MVDLYAIPGEALSSDPFGYYGVRGALGSLCNRGKVPLARGFTLGM